MNAVERIDKVLSSLDALTEDWRKLGNADEDDVVVVYAGEPNPGELADFVTLYERHIEVPYPQPLRSVLEKYNGLWVCTETVPAERLQRVPAGSLTEPHLWPIGYGDPNLLADIEIAGPGTPQLMAFAEIADSGYFGFAAVPNGTNEPVYWVDRSFRESPSRVADSLEAFFQRWCDASLRLSSILTQVRVPGWG